jgi:hypothetical protein
MLLLTLSCFFGKICGQKVSGQMNPPTYFSKCCGYIGSGQIAASMQQGHNDNIFKNKISAFLDVKLNVFEPHISKKLSLF